MLHGINYALGQSSRNISAAFDENDTLIRCYFMIYITCSDLTRIYCAHKPPLMFPPKTFCDDLTLIRNFLNSAGLSCLTLKLKSESGMNPFDEPATMPSGEHPVSAQHAPELKDSVFRGGSDSGPVIDLLWMKKVETSIGLSDRLGQASLKMGKVSNGTLALATDKGHVVRVNLQNEQTRTVLVSSRLGGGIHSIFLDPLGVSSPNSCPRLLPTATLATDPPPFCLGPSPHFLRHGRQLLPQRSSRAASSSLQDEGYCHHFCGLESSEPKRTGEWIHPPWKRRRDHLRVVPRKWQGKCFQKAL